MNQYITLILILSFFAGCKTYEWPNNLDTQRWKIPQEYQHPPEEFEILVSADAFSGNTKMKTKGKNLIESVKLRNHDEVKAFIKHNPNSVQNIDEKGLTALHYACANIDIYLCRQLLMHNPKKDMYIAASLYGLNEVKYTYNKKKLNQQILGYSPLMIATIAGKIDVMTFLIEKGATVNLRHKENGKTALHYAASAINLKAVELLLNKGADRNLKSKQGFIAVDLTSEFKHNPTRTLLLQPPM